MPDQRMTLRGYARSRGYAPSTVHAALVAGRITRGPDGLIDPAAADADWKANTDHRQVRGGAIGNTHEDEIEEDLFTPWGALWAIQDRFRVDVDELAPKLVGKSKAAARRLLLAAAELAWARLRVKWAEWYGPEPTPREPT